MNTRLNLFIILLFVIAVNAMAQDSTSVQPPVPEIMSVPAVPQLDTLEQKEDRVEVDKSALPPKMRDALSNEEKYAGWEDSPIYYEKNSDQYILHITKENSTLTYRFDKIGTPLTTDKPAEAAESKN